MIRFNDIFRVLKLQETLSSSVSSVLKLLQLFCRRNLSFCWLQQNILDVSLDWICEKLELNYLLTVFLFLSCHVVLCSGIYKENKIFLPKKKKVIGLGCFLIANISGFPDLYQLLNLSSSLLPFHLRPALISKATELPSFIWEVGVGTAIRKNILYLLSIHCTSPELTA